MGRGGNPTETGESRQETGVRNEAESSRSPAPGTEGREAEMRCLPVAKILRRDSVGRGSRLVSRGGRRACFELFSASPASWGCESPAVREFATPRSDVTGREVEPTSCVTAAERRATNVPVLPAFRPRRDPRVGPRRDRVGLGALPPAFPSGLAALDSKGRRLRGATAPFWDYFPFVLNFRTGCCRIGHYRMCNSDAGWAGHGRGICTSGTGIAELNG